MEIRKAVRAVIIDNNNNTPILKVKGGEYFKIPGGTIEVGESEDEALVREIKEEAGCEAEIIEKIGEFEFEGKESGRIYHSVCYLAKLIGEKGDAAFDDWESERDFTLIWLPLSKAIETFQSCHPEDEIEKIINERDMNFLIKAKEILTNE